MDDHHNELIVRTVLVLEWRGYEERPVLLRPSLDPIRGLDRQDVWRARPCDVGRKRSLASAIWWTTAAVQPDLTLQLNLTSKFNLMPQLNLATRSSTWPEQLNLNA